MAVKKGIKTYLAWWKANWREQILPFGFLMISWLLKIKAINSTEWCAMIGSLGAFYVMIKKEKQ